MTKFYSALIFILFAFNYENAFATPTIPCSNVQTIGKTCNSISISWTSGNGGNRLVVARYDSVPVFKPSNGATYGSNNAFGTFNSKVGNDEFVIYNGTNSSVNVTNLSQGRKLYFAIFEYDFNSGPQYLLLNSPIFNDSLYKLELIPNVTTLDSCEASNLYKFENNSYSDVPGLKYYVSTSNFDSLYTAPMYIHFNGNGFFQIKLRSQSVLSGCSDDTSYFTKIFPKRYIDFDFPGSSDTVQEFVGNLFIIKTLGRIMPFPTGCIYKWKFGDGDTSEFPKMQHRYKDEGRFKVTLINTALSINKLTNCRDTQSFTVLVGRNPFVNMIIAPKRLWKDSTYTYVSFIDSMVSSLTWRFGDGESSTNLVDSHKYKYGGVYTLELEFETTTGKIGYYETTIIVDSLDTDTNDNAINRTSINQMLIYPNPSNGLIHLDKLKIEGDALIRVMDGKGATIYTEYIKRLPETFDLSNFGQGQFTLYIESKQRIYIFGLSLE